MKLYKYSLIAALALSGALSACDDDNDYTPAAPVSGDEVYLPLSQDAEITIPENAEYITINVCRVKDDGVVTVPVTSSAVDGDGADVSSIFSVPSEVTFAAGEKTAELEVAVDFAEVVAEVDYVITVSLGGDQTTPYGASTREYTLAYSPWSAWQPIPGETAVYTDSNFEPGDYEVPVYISKSTIDDVRVKYAICNADWFFYRPSGSPDGYIDFEYYLDNSKTIDVNGVECPLVTMSTLISNYTSSSYDGNYMFTDMRTYLVDYCGLTGDAADQWMANRGYGQSYFNPETGTFVVDVLCTMTSFSGQWFYAAYDYLQLPGYKSYVINFDYTGNFVDPAGTEYAIVNAFKSDDVASFKADIFLGALDESGVNAAIEDIRSNDDLESYTASTTNLAYICDEAGSYTVVGIGYDQSGNEVCNAAYTFEYATVKANDPWKSIGYCEYTDGIVNSVFSIPTLTFDIEVQENEEDPGYYRLVDPYQAMASMFKNGTYPSSRRYMYIDARDPMRVSIEESTLGIDVGYGEMGCISVSAYYLAQGYSADVIANAGFFGVMENGVITFPTGMIYGFDDDGLFYANVDPENPTGGDNGDFDPTWGTGTFCIDMSSIAASAPAKAKATQMFTPSSIRKACGIKDVRSPRKQLKTVSAKDLLDYRKQNLRQFSF